MGRLGCSLLVLLTGCAAPKATPVAASALEPPRPSSPASLVSSSGGASGSAAVQALRARLGGDSVTLTLEPALQESAERAVHDAGKAAAAVVISPETGDVLALASVPGERGDPLLVAHAPASTFKPFVALAALEAGVLAAGSQRTCSGKFNVDGVTLSCFGVHGKEDVRKAIAASCNSFFYQVGMELDFARLAQGVRRFGYGERTGIELEDEAGFVPEAAEVTGRARAVEAIGHGKARITLLQLARAYAALANGGKLLRLGLVRSRRGTDGALHSVERPPATTIELAPSALETVRRGLLDAVSEEYGIAHPIARADLAFAAKTGSADAAPLPGAKPDAEPDTDRWLVAYAPASAPKIVIAVRVERGAEPPLSVVRSVLDVWKDTPQQRATQR